MAQPLSYEDDELTFFITTKTIGDRLWFIDNSAFEHAVLSYLAKYQSIYGVVLYAFVLMGNHYHLLAKFPRMNRAQFMRSFNAMVAKLATEYIPEFKEGRLWARRYSFQAIPLNSDIRNKFVYMALNPVCAGLCQHPDEYRGYNSFRDALGGRGRKFIVTDRMRFNDAKRYNSAVKIEDFQQEYLLRFERLPGYESLSSLDYQQEISRLIETERKIVIGERTENGAGFASEEYVSGVRVGAVPKNPKRSHRNSFRPLVITSCPITYRIFLERYFILLQRYCEASRAFLAGNCDVEFPAGTYSPSGVGVCRGERQASSGSP